jgi:hypothetical protein
MNMQNKNGGHAEMKGVHVDQSSYAPKTSSRTKPDPMAYGDRVRR